MVNIYAAAGLLSQRTHQPLVAISSYILSPEEHAQIIQQNFESKMAELMTPFADRKTPGHPRDSAKDAEQMKSDLTDKQIGRQEQTTRYCR